MNVKRKNNSVPVVKTWKENYWRRSYDSLTIEELMEEADVKYFLNFCSPSSESEVGYPIKYRYTLLDGNKWIMSAILKDASINISPDNINWRNRLYMSEALKIRTQISRDTVYFSQKPFIMDKSGTMSIKIVVPSNFIEKYLYIEYEVKHAKKLEIELCYQLDYQKIEEDWRMNYCPLYWGFTKEQKLKMYVDEFRNHFNELIDS